MLCCWMPLTPGTLRQAQTQALISAWWMLLFDTFLDANLKQIHVYWPDHTQSNTCEKIYSRVDSIFVIHASPQVLSCITDQLGHQARG